MRAVLWPTGAGEASSIWDIGSLEHSRRWDARRCCERQVGRRLVWLNCRRRGFNTWPDGRGSRLRLIRLNYRGSEFRVFGELRRPRSRQRRRWRRPVGASMSDVVQPCNYPARNT
jgi:hypothetical protein